MGTPKDATEIMIEEVAKTVEPKSEKVKVPAWARRVPKRTIVLAAVTVAVVILYIVMASVVASASSPAGNGGLFAPWRLNILTVPVLWVAVVSGASSLWTWLLHVRDREFIVREIAVRTQMSKRN